MLTCFAKIFATGVMPIPVANRTANPDSRISSYREQSFSNVTCGTSGLKRSRKGVRH